MRYMELLSIRETSLLLLVRLVLLNPSVSSDRVLRLTRRHDLLLSFYLGGDSGYEDILSEITLLDKVFRVLMERLDRDV